MPELPTLAKRWARRLGDLLRRPDPQDRCLDTRPHGLRLLAGEQIEQRGQALGRLHRLHPGRRPDRLLGRLRSNEASIDAGCALLLQMVQDELRITPAGEWLLDNHYLIQEQIQTARRHLPPGYSRELPTLSHGPSAQLPRVYDLASDSIRHADGRIDAEAISRFISAYQTVTPLKLGELWAIPIMLRLALIENLRCVCDRVVDAAGDRRLAGLWATRLNTVCGQNPKDIVLVMADLARSAPPLTGAFVAELSRGLHGRSAALAMPIQWIDQWLADAGHSIETLVNADSQQQAIDQVAISNSIGSLRFLSNMDWREFVETLSTVEQTLRQDPAGTYAQMDFATRDSYRHAVERMARQTGLAETDVARIVLDLAQAQANQGPLPGAIEAHVGYYLVDEGQQQSKRSIAAAGDLAGAKRRPLRLRRPRLPLPLYLLPIGLTAAAFTAALLIQLPSGQALGALPWLVAGLGLIAFSDLGIALVNGAATRLVAPQPLPRLDFAKGIPSTARTLVVVPCMLSNARAVAGLIEALEVRFLGNRSANLHFALLTDLLDASSQHLPEDDALLTQAEAGVAGLNARYADARGDTFFLFHRARAWNPREGVWMGFERKRGKLSALNRLLRNVIHEHALAGFERVVGDVRPLLNVRYVITLDTDTTLPRDSARKLVGTIAHPLNRARFDPLRRTVKRGYGILQPSVGSSCSGSGAVTRYTRLFGASAGIDPYTLTTSDVYQDLFGEGSFIGKGIYDVDAFEHALHDRLPDNRILSHDLLEGCYARAGLVSDVWLYETPPSRYAVDAKRRYRWIRGDWQLLAWLLPWVPRAAGGHERNPLSLLARGKLLDNLRRSLVPAALTALLMIGWSVLDAPLVWTLWLLGVPLLPVLLPTLPALVEKPAGMAVRPHIRQVLAAAGRRLAAALVGVACLCFEAWYSLDAAARSLWRTGVSRRHLLQWNPSSEVERSLGARASPELRSMLFAPGFALLGAGLLWQFNPGALCVAAPILGAWLLSPGLMAWLGRPRPHRRAPLAAADLAFLGRLARRTWGFFEAQVRLEDHWLPPDNVQEHPAWVVARRTSPTNIGLSLLANLAARDFGYLQSEGVIERTRNVFDTLDRLQRYRGHFYNWYDTETLLPLQPLYVSTVDSGNLAGHLLTLRQGLLALIDAPILAPASLQGLADTLGVLEDSRTRLPAAERAMELDAAIAAFRVRLQLEQLSPQVRPSAAAEGLAALEALAAAIATAWPTPTDDPAGAAEPLWPQALQQACRHARTELAPLAPIAGSETAAERASVEPARLPTLREMSASAHSPAAAEWARQRIEVLEQLAHRAGQFALLDYDFLYDRGRRLLAIGYSVEERRLDSGHYDLLASEARLCSFVAIAQGRLPQETWFALGRLLTSTEGKPTLLSWSGSMFEYLMPQLVMPSYPDTLLDQTARHAVHAQRLYAKRRGLPWGISESGYNARDARLNYQYRAFGVPGLGLKRGLSQDLVIAPYASMMALMVAPVEACENLQRLTAEGFAGRFGLFEAIDYTPERLPRGHTHAVVRSFMAHHQGMGLLALAHLLHDQPMQKRFCADPEIQATLLLLQERIPNAGFFHPHQAEANDSRAAPPAAETQLRIIRDPNRSQPAVQLLSNGRYHSLLSSAGGGYSRLQDMAVTRWREDGTRDNWGSFCYLRDLESGALWSATYQPSCVEFEHYEAIFSDAKAEYRTRLHGIDTHLEIAISPEDNIELRRLHLRNRSRGPRRIEITTYAEVALSPPLADELHPAFSNLFVQTEVLAAKQALLCTRRARSHEEIPPWMLHLMAVHDADAMAVSYETDRSRFLGRGGSPRQPQALQPGASLSGSAGSVLDPIVAIRCQLLLQPEQSAVIDMVTGVGADRHACTELIDKYRDRTLADRVFDLAWTHSQVVRLQINATQADAQLYERLAGLMVFANPLLRSDPAVLLQNRRGQSGLWRHSISGDLPIVLVQIADVANIELVRQMVQAHAYWRLKGLQVDLVIWNEDQAGYRQQLQDQILALVSAGPEGNVLDKPGGIFVRPIQQISQEERILLQAVARVVVGDRHGTLAAQMDRRPPAVRLPPPLLADPAAAERTQGGPDTLAQPPEQSPWAQPAQGGPGTSGTAEARQFENTFGGFSADGSEYVIDLREGHPTPAPWCNVLANARFGSVVSESAPGYTWFENAHAFRLTPWHNDPVADSGGEAYYLRDEVSGEAWSPMPLPLRGRGDYRTRHGFGYSVYTHEQDGIASELWVFVAREEPIKFALLKVHNRSQRPRRLSAIGYVEWVLGDLRLRTQMHLACDLDPLSGALRAHNPYSEEFSGRVAFFDADADTRSASDAGPRSFTADRCEFLGRNGSLGQPAALRRERLSGRLGVGLDPCAAIQIPFELAPGEHFETCFRLGVGIDAQAASSLALGSQGSAAAHAALQDVRDSWQRTLSQLQVHTPEPGLDLLANGWLLYQTLASRCLGRSGFYQSGGAFGFRDQLQDTMASLHAEPALTREHLLRCAAKQFVEGDVLHWWHPPQGRGVRTHCSDDYLWLPLATCRYLDVTADFGILDEPATYLEGRSLNADEESYYDLPLVTGLQEPLYAHCVRALKRGMRLQGARGLPLIGSGDWNDGMNRVGIEGRGESVWLGFFLFDVLSRFAKVAQAHGDDRFAGECLQAAERLRRSLKEHAWDGDWFRRAWYDDGTPLGSASSDECRIDSISQSWSVLSGAADEARARQAMESLHAHLVRADAGLIQLLHPPFDRTEKDPGYIRGYVPGVRENGGQYTHAAVWAAMAFARLGDRERAWQLARMINPIGHSLNAEAAARYRVEPYVLAADVYGVAPHIGRGGWTWYTGSASWMYRLLVESLLGLQREGPALVLRPCIPADWREYRIDYRFGSSVYRILLRQRHPESRVEGEPAWRNDSDVAIEALDDGGFRLALRDDGQEHCIELQLAGDGRP
ncbi:MAG: cyclic beta 1-2 glucan synthetase [Aquimonas sp.]|nr:cyclic beta 1-2 glucan synthetase [Aquimonas sp.]